MKNSENSLFDTSFAAKLLRSLGKVGTGQEKAANDSSYSSSEKKRISEAEAALRSLSNAELSDLGISRGEIPYVVRHGRPGIDPDPAGPSGQVAA